MLRFHLVMVVGPLIAAGSPLAATELPHVPDGYTVEVVAEAPLVQHPMMAAFDERGRLFIAESAGTNRRAEELIEEPLDFIRMLEDTDGDGRFDESTIFADKLTFPQGVLCHEGAVFTCAPPHVWKLEDTDDDGICDKRTELVTSFGFNGNGASIHGPFLGPDDRLYWCDGRHGHEFFNETGEIVSTGKAARIFSCQPDGGDVRTFAGGGMDNPVEVDWLDTGEMIGTVNLFYGRPRGDVLVHWVEGGVYPRFDQQDCIDEFPWTGGLLPEIHNYGHVAVSGMCRERFAMPDRSPPASGGRQPADASDDAPASTRASSADDAVNHDSSASDSTNRGADAPRSPGGSPAAIASVLITQFNTHKVVRTRLAREGSTFQAIGEEDLIVWDNPDVHPTDVLEAPDGSILAIDTGGWFRIGCPTSQIAKPEIPGAIYRIRRTDSPSREVVTDDGQSKRESFEEAVTSVAESADSSQRLRSLQVVSQALAVRKQQMNIPANELVAAVMEGADRGIPDRHLEHSIVTALIRIDNAQATRTYLESSKPPLRRVALIALDQMEGGDLTEDDVIALLDTADSELLKTVLEVISRNAGWVAETVPLFRNWLTAEQTTRQRVDVMREFFLAQAHDLWVQELVGDALSQPKTHPKIRQMLIDVVASADVDPLPPLWADSLRVPLGLQSDPESRLAAMRTISARGVELHDDWLMEIALFDQEPPAARIEAFAALAPRMKEIPADLFAFALQELTGDGDLLEKLTLAQGVANGPLDDARLLTLANALEFIGPAVVPVLLPAFENSDHQLVGETLVRRLSTMGDALSLSPQELGKLLERYPASVQQAAEPLLAKLGVDLEAQAAKLEDLQQATREGGDPSRGRSVFFSRTAGCSVCHRVGQEGGQVGPALTNIGAIRQPRDLLESIAFPSSSFAREYRPFTVLTDDGRIYSGIIRSRTSDIVVLQTTDLKEIRIPRKSIDVMQQSDTSIMPKGLETKLSPAELTDLLAYLQSLR